MIGCTFECKAKQVLSIHLIIEFRNSKWLPHWNGSIIYFNLLLPPWIAYFHSGHFYRATKAKDAGLVPQLSSLDALSDQQSKQLDSKGKQHAQ